MFGKSKRSYGPFVGIDLMFIVLGLTSVMIIVRSGFEAGDVAEAARNPWLVGFGLVAVVCALSCIAVFSAKFDQRINDEFVYRALANGAAIAMFVGLIVHIAFELLPMESFGIGGLSLDRFLGMLLASWSIGYAVNRIGGTSA